MRARGAHSTVTPALATVILVLFSLAGLFGGVLTHGLVGGGGQRVRQGTESPTVHQKVPAHQSPTSVATQAEPNAHFTLAMTFTPAQIRRGDALTITVHATVSGTTVPVAHLICTLSAPGGGSPLLTAWPAPAQTDALGAVAWQVTVPQLAPGQYGVKVSARASDSYSAFWISWIQVTS